MKITIRPETEEDCKDITRIHDLAFNRCKEGVLVEKLGKTARFISELSLVAEYKNRIVGHILFYPIKINAETRKCDSLALAPMAVHPNYQKRGIGSKMIEKGLTMAKKLGFKSVIVIGHPKYYPRFGFAAASKWEIRAPFNVPEDAFLAVELTRNGLKNCRGTLEYPREFDRL